MAQYSIVENKVVVNVIEATEAYILANHSSDIVVLGTLPIGYIYEGSGTFRSPDTVTPDANAFVDTQAYNPVFTGDTLPLTNIAISTPATLVGAIYWLQKDTLATVTANVGLPDDYYMIMAERVINGSTVVDDVRFKATVVGGVISMPVNFPIPGNYLISATRLNEGLDRIGAGVHLSFDSVEFDIYV